MTTKAAIWVRVSTDHQHESNQLSAPFKICFDSSRICLSPKELGHHVLLT
jgi:hypothetical protein